MLNIEMTQQEKKELAGIYGFLVEVWNTRQSRNTAGHHGLQRIAGKPVNKNFDDKIVNLNK